VQGRDWFYDSFAKFTNSIADPRWPVLLVLDTFEEVQYRSTAFVEGVFDFLDALQQRLPMLRTVLAGRAPVKLDKYSVNELKLPPFDPLAARAFLRKEFRLEGIVDDALAVIVADQVGGSPLSLKLAARLIRVSGRDQIGPEGIRNLSTGMGSTGALGDFLRDTGFLKYIVGQSVDGQLYTRILDHIHDPEVRKLAHPGLILRRITPDLILKVLAEPCGVIVPDEATAQKLFDELKKEIPLVEQTESDALIHRTDVREMMLESMKRSDEQRTREINERAIKYYAQFPDPRSRGEELYHLLLFEDFDRKRVEARVMHEALPFVLHSILELPERAQAFIAARTNTELEAKTWQKADLEDWELHAVQASRDFLSLGKFEAAAGVLHERSSRSAGSPVYAAEIEAYLAAGNLKRAASLAASYIDASFRQSDDAPLLDAALCRARVDAQTEVVQPIKEIVPVMDRLLAGPRPDPSLLSVLALYDRRYTDTGDRQIIQRWRDNLFNSKPAPSIAIADGFGLNILARLNPDSAFAKYFQQLPSFSVLQQNLASLQDVPLAEFPRKLAPIGLLFTRNTWVAWTSPVFAGSGAVSAALRVVTDGNLFDPDPFGSPINVPKGHAYLGLRVNATLAPKVGIPSEKPTFGFAAGSPVYMSHYKSFATIRVTKASAAAPTFKSALEATLQNFIIPLTPNDLSGIGVGDVAVIEGTGTFKFSGSFNLQTSVNPLVSVSSAAQPETLQIREGATIEILASCTITGDLQTRIEKVDAGTIRVGLYRKRGAEFTVQVSPSVGKTTGTTNTDFITAVLGAIGPSPFPSADELKKAGLTGKKQEEIVDALKTAIQKELELSVQAGLQGLSSQEAAFLYEISLRDLGPEGRTALQDALRLNFSKLSEPAPALPVGIREIQSLHTTTRSKGHSLKFNILGIYNFTSVSDLTLKGAVLTDPASGEVLITDRATATRVSGATNFLADSDKLRTVLAQSFLMTVAYRCSGLIAQAPSLKVSFRHFSEHAKTDRTTMQANLDVICNMGLITASQEQQSLTDAGDFGRSSFYLRTDYDDALSQGLFLRNDGQARALDEYEQIGRQALRAFLHAGDVDGYRLRSLESDAIWQQVKATGGTVGNLASLFPDLRSDTQIPVIAGDYLLIEWWATTMSKLAVTLSAAKRFFAQKPAPATNSPAFQKAQDDLWHQLAAAASSTHDRFSDPWGLMAMDLASGQQSTASARIVSPRLTLSAERAKYRSL